MTEFDERLEGEMKTHEKEMLRKIVINKYGDKPLPERIEYVMKTYPKDTWTAEEMFARLTELGLNANISLPDIKYLFTNSPHSFSVKVIE